MNVSGTLVPATSALTPVKQFPVRDPPGLRFLVINISTTGSQE